MGLRFKLLSPIFAPLYALALLTGCGDNTNLTAKTLLDSTKVNDLLDNFYNAELQLSPTDLTALGLKDKNYLWDDISDNGSQVKQDLYISHLNELKLVATDTLDEKTTLSVNLMKLRLQETIENFTWRHHDYPINQIGGWHEYVPTLLITQHSIDTAEDAEAYISRLGRVQTLFDQLIQQLRTRASLKVMPPKFAFDQAITTCENIITGAPFDKGADSPLLADFKTKVTALSVSDEQKQALLEQGISTLENATYRAYRKLIAFLTALSNAADERAGAWKLPDGEAYYANRLKHYTTTELSADDIHQVGLDEVERIKVEMNIIRTELGFDGDLTQFLDFLRIDSQFSFLDSEAGRAAYLQLNVDIIAAMEERLPEMFGVFPKAALEVRPVEAYREAAATAAFYQPPSLDGSRPGVFYTNLNKMANIRTFQVNATAYHEAVPGHHMQLAIAQELTDIPMFRKFSHNSAYVEGWALYAELLAKELGFYQDPYANFGRLDLEMMRAIRLVVDTGIHSKQWSRQQAIDYFYANSAQPMSDIVKEIDRYIVWPGQATAYKIGMLKILQLRANAQRVLGEQFDISAFHDLILSQGAMPLKVLEEQLDAWIVAQTIED
jgi:uncharacterized protein (DUF885 family)